MGHRDRFDGEFDALVARARSGDGAALERIYTTLAPVVAGYARLQGSHEPDDLTSEVFLGVLRNIGRFQGGESEFRSWVFTIAHRRLVDERRAVSRRPAFQPLEESEVDPVSPDDVESRVEQLLATRNVQELCERLVPAQRDVLLLRLVGQLTVPEVAAIVDRSVGAVKALQRRGFAAIERLIAHEEVTRP